jgi:hypothetical protein
MVAFSLLTSHRRSCAYAAAGRAPTRRGRAWVRAENALFEPFLCTYVKTINLPRQARDKFSETLTKDAFPAGEMGYANVQNTTLYEFMQAVDQSKTI